MLIRQSLALLLVGSLLIVAGCGDPAESSVDGTDGANGANADDRSTTPGADAEEIALTEENTTIAFVGTKDDGRHDGGFRELEGSLSLADDSIQSVHITVQTESLYADNPKLENHLKDPDFFEVKAHPELSFASTRIEASADGDATHTIVGDLTMLGKTNSIEVPATIDVSSNEVHLESEFTIDRTQWGMNYRPDQVHKDVQITVSIGATK